MFGKLLDFIETILIALFKLASVMIICGTILAIGINYYG